MGASNTLIDSIVSQSASNRLDIAGGVYISGSEQDEVLLDIQGVNGQLFAVTDSLIGDLFTVSDISGIPILNVHSDGVVTNETLVVNSELTIPTSSANPSVAYTTEGDLYFNTTDKNIYRYNGTM